MFPKRLVLTFSALVLITACGQAQMVETTGKIRAHMIQRNFQGALGTLQLSKNEGFKEQDRVVYWMNEGMLLHLTGQYQASNAVLEQAEKRSYELFTKSVSKDVKAAFTSDAAKDYSGEDYENVLVNVVKALNYLALNDVQEALVEARKINERLLLYNQKYQQANVYNQDAFAHWMMGILFELEKSYDDARIAYQKALEVYNKEFAANYMARMPSYVPEDLVRAALLSGDTQTAQAIRAQFGAQLGASFEELKTKGEIILVHLNGEGPSKTDYFINCYFESAVSWRCDGEPGGEFMKKTTITVGKGTALKVAFPQLIIREPVNPFLIMSAGGVSAQSEMAEPISRIAIKVLADKTGRIFKDAVIRAITKYLTTKASEKAGEAAGGAMVGFLTKTAASVAMQATEEADKRAWITLPSRIEIARVRVPAGTYDVNVQLPRSGMAQPIRGVKVEPGKRVFLTYLTLP